MTIARGGVMFRRQQIIRRSHLTHIPLTHQLRILCIMLLLVLVQQQRRIKGWLHARIVAGHGILRKIIIVRVRVEQVRIIRVMIVPTDPTDPETSPQTKKRTDRFAPRGYCAVAGRR